MTEPREARVGGLTVGRVLPRRSRRMVGPWCFVDRMGPGHVDAIAGLDVGPHPHIGLQTVTWLLDGAILHRDSLGSEQLIRPGQLNLMTAGHGVSHSEETRDVHVGDIHGIQFWVAQPSSTRDGAADFEHHAELPQLGLGSSRATVLVGDFAGSSSPARRDSEHVGVELALSPGPTTVPLAPGFEHALLAIGDGVSVRGRALPDGHLGYLGIGIDEVIVDTEAGATVMLIGGEPFPEELLMWWNYVARTRDEIIQAHQQWSEGSPRFGTVDSPLERIDTAAPPWPPT